MSLAVSYPILLLDGGEDQHSARILSRCSVVRGQDYFGTARSCTYPWFIVDGYTSGPG